MWHTAMFYSDNSQGGVFIRKVANGFEVTMPIVERNAALEAYRAMPAIIGGALRDKELEPDHGKQEETKQEDEPGFELSTCKNVFVFAAWQDVIDFLIGELSEE